MINEAYQAEEDDIFDIFLKYNVEILSTKTDPPGSEGKEHLIYQAGYDGNSGMYRLYFNNLGVDSLIDHKNKELILNMALVFLVHENIHKQDRDCGNDIEPSSENYEDYLKQEPEMWAFAYSIAHDIAQKNSVDEINLEQILSTLKSNPQKLKMSHSNLNIFKDYRLIGGETFNKLMEFIGDYFDN